MAETTQASCDTTANKEMNVFLITAVKTVVYLCHWLFSKHTRNKTRLCFTNCTVLLILLICVLKFHCIYNIDGNLCKL